MSNKNLSVTSLSDLKRYSEGDIVELPPFSNDKPFVARLKRPSLLVLAKNGMIPNSLLVQANEMFYGQQKRVTKDALANTFDVIEIMCEAAFVEPTYKDIKDSGIQMTDQQYLAVYNYTQTGMSGLASFRKEQGDI